ncbi:hypothetical protein [Hufsiella ginkgonis]|uniref:Phage tail protein n=1 Tax=Hufsiella ginkgonis TaxID=2695274 RepID=A0A7K1Y2C1_9SPHI|nr:hypothetical protein [Hufsiella ginkgonis]MXV16826.1 hypothetical protein [Hufsiella ginkgonis]
MNAKGLYFLEGLDMWLTYGWAPLSGSDDFVPFPERKDPPSHDWGDEDGIEYDLTTPVFMNRQVTIGGTLHASSRTDYNIKRAALWNALKAPGQLDLMVADLGTTYQVFYSKSSGKKYTKINANKVVVELNLTFTIINV